MQKKYCKYKNCGKEMVRKMNEPQVVFNRREYCSRECAYKDRKNKPHPWNYPKDK